VSGYVELIKEKSRVRRILNLCEVTQSRAIDGEDSSTLLHDLQTAALAHQADDGDLRPMPITELVVPFLDKLRQERERPDELRGISTGIPDLDAITTGWREGELSYLGALPGRGKTAFMVQIMHAAAKLGTKAGFISLEMTKDQIMRRLATIQTGLHPSRFRDAGTMKDSDWRHTVGQSQSIGGLGDLPIEIYDRSGLRVREIAAVARRMHASGCKIIFIDFVQAIRQEGRDAREAINDISAVLRDTCKALQVPFVVASQLARRDANPNRRPTMQDLRESGNLEQDAHNVLLLYRPQASQKDEDEQERAPVWSSRDEIILAKQREGLTGSVEVVFEEGSLTFQPRGERRSAGISGGDRGTSECFR
jgi:replicative DNA helicase